MLLTILTPTQWPATAAPHPASRGPQRRGLSGHVRRHAAARVSDSGIVLACLAVVALDLSPRAHARRDKSA